MQGEGGDGNEKQRTRLQSAGSWSRRRQSRKKERKVVSSKSSVPAKSAIRWRRATSDHHHHHRHQRQPDCRLKWSTLDGHLARFQPEEVMDLEEREREKRLKSNREIFVLETLPPSVLRTLRTGHAGPESNRKKITRSFLSRSLALIHRTDLALNDCSLVSISLIWAIIISITAIRRVFPSW